MPLFYAIIGIYDSKICNRALRKSLIEKAMKIVVEYEFDGIGT